MRHRREDVVRSALALLDAVGLPDLTMRRLAKELDVQPSALYHHFPDKQSLLAAVADAILAERNRVPEAGDWQARAMAVCQDLRRVLLAHTDGAELVASMSAFGLGGRGAYEDLRAILGRTAAGVEVPAGPTAPAAAVLPREGGLTDRAAGRAARTLLHFVYGHAVDEQTYDQLARFGAVAKDRDAGDFAAGVELILAGIAQAVSTTTP